MSCWHQELGAGCQQSWYWQSFHRIFCPRHHGLSSQIAKFMGPTWGPPGSCRPQMGPMLAPKTLLSGFFWLYHIHSSQQLLYFCVTNHCWLIWSNLIVTTMNIKARTQSTALARISDHITSNYHPMIVANRPLLLTWFNFNPSSSHIHNIVWAEITYPFPNLNGWTVEVWERLNNSIPHL